jgi:hypothetical protein
LWFFDRLKLLGVPGGGEAFIVVVIDFTTLLAFGVLGLG